MLKISFPAAADAARKPTHRPATGFALPPDAAPAEALNAASSIAPAGLLGLQEVDPSVGDRAARRQGEALLDELAELQRALLGGVADPAALARLALLARLPRAADPRLDAILRALACRAGVEIARRRAPLARD